MRVAGRGLDLGVLEELADHGQTFAHQQPVAGEAAEEVMDPHVDEPGARPDAQPGVPQVGQLAAKLAPGDKSRVVLLPVDRLQHRDRRSPRYRNRRANLEGACVW